MQGEERWRVHEAAVSFPKVGRINGGAAASWSRGPAKVNMSFGDILGAQERLHPSSSCWLVSHHLLPFPSWHKKLARQARMGQSDSPGDPSSREAEEKPSRMCRQLRTMDEDRLISANENLKNEIWDLRDVVANLEVKKKALLAENRRLKEQNKSLDAKIHCFKATIEDLCKVEEELRATLSQVEETMGEMESHNQALKEASQMLRTKIQNESSHVFSCQDYKGIQEQDLSRMKEVMGKIAGYFRDLEANIEIAERQYKEERSQVAELTRTLGELEQLQEVQENEAVSNGILSPLSRLMWLLPAAIVCMGIWSWSEVLSPHSVRKPSGLRPF